MTESANSLARRKAQTAHRITVCAQRLAVEHGLDGFTMDDLAEAAEVSRRTLFNYYSGKEDAVLGGHHDFPEEPLAKFRAGGPDGALLKDAAWAITQLLDAQPVTPDEAALSKRVFDRNPELMYAATKRLEAIADQFRADVAARTGWAPDDERATLTIALLIALVQQSVERHGASTGNTSLAEVFAETARQAIELTQL